MSQYDELKLLAEASRVANHDERGPDEAFQEALHPEVVLALIAENEAYASRLHEVAMICATAEQERDQLRAENAGLKTGYQAYERVNAELRAENERLERNRNMWKGQVERQAEELTALRKDAERYQWLRDSSESIHQFYLSTPIWFTGVKFSKDNVDSTIDAAMGKGEQP